MNDMIDEKTLKYTVPTLDKLFIPANIACGAGQGDTFGVNGDLRLGEPVTGSSEFDGDEDYN